VPVAAALEREICVALAARGNLAVACEAAGDLGQAIPPYARLMTCANT